MSIFDRYESPITVVDRMLETDYSYADPEMVNQDVAATPPKFGLFTHAIYAAVILVVLTFRLAYVQIVQGQGNAVIAKEHSVRQIIQPASRGTILDKRGVWLARNAPSFRVIVTATDLPRLKQDREGIYAALADVLQWNETDKKTYTAQIESRLKFQLDSRVIVKDNIGHDEALRLITLLNDLAGVTVATKEVRQYNQPLLGLSHIVGYVGQVSDDDIKTGQYRRIDVVGKSGLEATYDKDLRGRDGVLQAVVDSKGKILRSLTDRGSEAVPGATIVLSLDLKLQTIMAKELQDGLTKAGLTSGVTIAMDPRSGAIRGMVSLPAYDNNRFASGISSDLYDQLMNNPEKPLFNRATQGTYPSGSIIKPFIAALGLQNGIITDKTRIDTPPAITVGQWTFPNWQNEYLYGVDVKTAIAKSNDIFFYALGGGWDKIKGLGVDQLAKGLPLFGFGGATGIDLPTESIGLVPNPTWKKEHQNEAWYIGDTYHLSIGQGDFLATPLQLVTALSAVANGGTLYQPHLVDRLMDKDGNTTRVITPVVTREHFIDDKNIQVVRDGMRQAVTDGSARQLQSLTVTSAAKTGTAQMGANNEFLHSWFEAFAPFDNPEIAIVVLGEKGSQQNEGNTTAEPIAKAIMDQYFSPDFQK